MRTSGASYNDSFLVVLTLVIAGGIVTMLLGGPREVIFIVEHMTRSAVTALGDFIRSL
jgi:hypothetical protein